MFISLELFPSLVSQVQQIDFYHGLYYWVDRCDSPFGLDFTPSIMKLIDQKKAIIFDLFDTLTDHETNWSEIPRASKMLNLNSMDWNRQLLFNSMDRLTGKMSDPYQIVESLAHSIDSSIPEDLIREVVHLRTLRYQDALKNIPAETIVTLSTLRQMGLKIALLSNADVMERSGWENSPLMPFFDVALFSCDAGYAKPDGRFYELCMLKLNLQPTECLFVGDGGSNELLGAKDCGITAVFISDKMERKYPDKVDERKRISDYTIHHIPDILELECFVP